MIFTEFKKKYANYVQISFFKYIPPKVFGTWTLPPYLLMAHKDPHISVQIFIIKIESVVSKITSYIQT